MSWVVTGTDTDAGKTVFSAMLTLAFQGIYWKPIQSGLPRDADQVRKWTDLSADHFLPERYLLNDPVSPHLAAQLQGTRVEIEELALPLNGNRGAKPKPLIIEGAGGLLVPLNNQHLQVDLFQRWGLPLILCVRTRLGMINHALLSIEAIYQRRLNLLGLAFIETKRMPQEDMIEDSKKTICHFSGEKNLGTLPFLAEINSQTLLAAFRENFNASDFTGGDRL